MSSNDTKKDRQYMRRCLTLARRAWGCTSPNPMVGCVIVKDDRVLAEGYHRCAGAPHAEAVALTAVTENPADATLYVNLEPCSTHGRTPPCVEAILKAGISRVVIACLDPFPGHEGRAVEKLRRHNVEVEINVLQSAAEELNEAFLCRAKHRRPFVLLKMAMTLDGKIATAGGRSKWITGSKARDEVQKLRQWSDAVMVGGETVRQDDPDLRVRNPANWEKQPRKLIWTSRKDFAGSLRIWQDPGNPPVFIQPNSKGAWNDFLHELAEQDITALLVEGGGELAAQCLDKGIVDKVAFFIAPKILGGRGSRPVVGGRNPASLDEALKLHNIKTRKAGDDLLYTGYLSDVHRSY
ncbi:MAG: bifunctional diaminohydroxyphosphoribosylaminopyrimidine deaminase/5-amino-6-(5-phosphoribosylamino)uracil reductase RibD [Lentisphaeria bacterium]